MGVVKSDLFSAKQNELAGLMRVLAHPARIAILEHLVKANDCINSDLVKELGLAQPTISQHLKELKNSGLIQGTIEGVSVSYCINLVNWRMAQELINGLFNTLPLRSEGACC